MPPGRPPKLTREQVLDAAVALCRREGLGAASVADLCQQTGQAAQSLYNAFGDKAGLGRAVAERFGEVFNEPTIRALRDARDPAEALRDYARSWHRNRGAGRDGGCLFTQSLARAGCAQSGGADAVALRYTLRVRHALRDTARRAARHGQLRPHADPAALADALLTLAFGVAVVGRGGLPGPVIDHAIDAALRLIDDATATGSAVQRALPSGP